TPIILKQSARFGVRSNSNTASFKFNRALTSSPISTFSGKIKIPSSISFGTYFSSIPISCKEQIIPFDSTPRNLTFLIFTFPGKTAPGLATITFCPCLIFGAPHIICSFSCLHQPDKDLIYQHLDVVHRLPHSLRQDLYFPWQYNEF